MAAARGQTLGRSSFSRAASNPATSSSGAAGVKLGPNGAAFVSSGIPDLDSKQLLAHKNLLSPMRKIPLLLLCSRMICTIFSVKNTIFYWHRCQALFFRCISARCDGNNAN
jgi:hypothetical protein